MIQKINAYKSSDGTAHSTLEEAQKHELIALFRGDDEPSGDRAEAYSRDVIAARILHYSDEIIDILTMKPNSLPKARKINGGTKKRTPKHIAEQATMFTEPPKAATA